MGASSLLATNRLFPASNSAKTSSGVISLPNSLKAIIVFFAEIGLAWEFVTLVAITVPKASAPSFSNCLITIEKLFFI